MVARDWLLIPFSRIAYRDPSAAFPHVDTLGQILVSGDRIGKQYAAKILGMVAGDNPDLVVPYTDELRGVWSYHDRNLKTAALPAIISIATPPVTDTVPDWLYGDFTTSVQAQDDVLRGLGPDFNKVRYYDFQDQDCWPSISLGTSDSRCALRYARKSGSSTWFLPYSSVYSHSSGRGQ